MKNTYWNNNGKHQSKLEDLNARLIPQGSMEGPMELFRCFSKLYYDVYNNGGGNFSVLKDDADYVLEHVEIIPYLPSRAVWDQFVEMVEGLKGEAGRDVKYRCEDCSGSGDIECSECDGWETIEETDYEDCDECDGSGDCSECDGDGCEECEETGSCNACDGDGSIEIENTIDCPTCDGEGTEVCDVCEGHGYYIEWEPDGTVPNINNQEEGWAECLEQVTDAVVLHVTKQLEEQCMSS
tara:strand:+ start:1000 stop:1716 length:717 start_codon:yes stop_codon:yes gene_type:complete